jgi:hypothetical protein
MGGAVPPLPQYAFIVWCSVRRSTELLSTIGEYQDHFVCTTPNNIYLYIFWKIGHLMNCNSLFSVWNNGIINPSKMCVTVDFIPLRQFGFA